MYKKYHGVVKFKFSIKMREFYRINAMHRVVEILGIVELTIAIKIDL